MLDVNGIALYLGPKEAMSESRPTIWVASVPLMAYYSISRNWASGPDEELHFRTEPSRERILEVIRELERHLEPGDRRYEKVIDNPSLLTAHQFDLY